MTEADFKAVCEWIGENIHAARTDNLYQSSYCLKHLFERDTGIYVSNNDFKRIMVKMGFIIVPFHRLKFRRN